MRLSTRYPCAPAPRWRQRIAACALVLIAGSTHAAQPVGDKPSTVQDLHYGEVLFHFYQQDYFTAMARLLTAQTQEYLDFHADEAELLLGGMQVSFGMPAEAQTRFERLLSQHPDDHVRDKAWLYLAKLAYERDYQAQALQALERIGDSEDKQLRAEQRMLRARMLMAGGDHAEAARLLEQGTAEKKPAADWYRYLLFNQATALLLGGEAARGEALLDELVSLRTREPEEYALRDRAALALALHRLHAENFAGAQQAIELVRMQGPWSDQALLALGWIHAENDAPEQALVPWQELAARDSRRPAVQEALLAVPYALAELEAPLRALEQYRFAINAYAQEGDRLTEAVQHIEGGGFAEALAGDPDIGYGWFWRLQSMPEHPALAYLDELMADHDFQEALKNFRDADLLTRKLAAWREDLAAYRAMIETRRLAFAERAPAVDAALAQVDVPALHERHRVLAEELDTIEQKRDLVALADESQRAQWQRLQELGQRIAGLDAHPQQTQLAAKQSLLRGVLLWELNAQYAERRWQAEKILRELAGPLADARRGQAAVETARSEAPARFEGFDQRVDRVQMQLEQLQPRALTARSKHARLLEQLAMTGLHERALALQEYQLQARFAMAQLLDRGQQAAPAAAEGDAP